MGRKFEEKKRKYEVSEEGGEGLKGGELGRLPGGKGG